MTNDTTLKSYHNDPSIKAEYIDRIKDHREADRLVQGVGCTVNEDEEPHSLYPPQLGIPVWLAHLEDARSAARSAARSDAIIQRDWLISELEKLTK